MEQRVRACLPADLASHCWSGGLIEGCLRLFTDSPAWAARLRFHGPKLARELSQQNSLAVRTVQVRIIPPAAPRPAPARSISLSAENARLLEQTARAIKDPSLARALMKLSRRGARPVG